MEHIAAFLLIVGCSGDLTRCEELPAPVGVFETIEDCDAELGATRGGIRSDHDKLFASCFEVDPLLTEVDAEIVWDVSADGELSASVEPIGSEEVLIASTDRRRPEDSPARR